MKKKMYVLFAAYVKYNYVLIAGIANVGHTVLYVTENLLIHHYSVFGAYIRYISKMLQYVRCVTNGYVPHAILPNFMTVFQS